MRSPLLRLTTLGCSVLVSVAVAVFWVRSYWVVDTFSWSNTSDDHMVGSGGGRLVYGDAHWPHGRVAVWLRHDGVARDKAAWFERPEHGDGFRFGGFEYSKEVLPYQMTGVWFYVPPWRLLGIPYGAVFALGLILPATRLAGWLRRMRRRRRGLCVYCGYDLRASGARCPECGLGV